MKDFKQGKKAISGHGFPSDFGFSGSTGKSQNIGSYTRKTPMKKAEGGAARKTIKTGSPGISGAIHDVVESVSRAIAPKSISQRKARLEQQEKDAGYAEGGKVEGNAATLRNEPANELDAETGGKSTLRPGFSKGGKMHKALGGPVRAAKGGALAAVGKGAKSAVEKKVAAAKPKGAGGRKGYGSFNRTPLIGR